MDATLHQHSPVDFELEVSVPHADLAAREKTALKRQAGQMNLKGFRPGRVPASMVKKMYGEAIAAQIAEEVVSDAFRKEVLGKEGGPEPLGQPRLTEMTYALGGDLHARIHFGTRPDVQIADLSGVEVTRLTRAITDEDVEKEAERQLRKNAVLVPSEEPIAEDAVATVDMQELDKATNTPVIGRRQDDIEVELDDERLRDELREALMGKTAGDTFTVDLAHEHGDDEGHDHDDHVDRYQVTVKAVRVRQLPDLDDAFVKDATNGRLDAVPVWKAELRSEMERAFERISSEMAQEQMVREMLERHDFPLPSALVDQTLDEMEQEAARRNNGRLPTASREAFRDEQREAAEGQIRWMLLKDQLIADEGIELTDEDYEREFDKLAQNGPASADQIKAYFTQQPNLLQNLERRLLNDRLFEALGRRFKLVEKTTEEAQAEAEKA